MIIHNITVLTVFWNKIKKLTFCLNSSVNCLCTHFYFQNWYFFKRKQILLPKPYLFLYFFKLFLFIYLFLNGWTTNFQLVVYKFWHFVQFTWISNTNCFSNKTKVFKSINWLWKYIVFDELKLPILHSKSSLNINHVLIQFAADSFKLM